MFMENSNLDFEVTCPFKIRSLLIHGYLLAVFVGLVIKSA